MKYTFLFLACFLLFSCKTDIDPKEVEDDSEINENETISENKDKNIEILFDETSFPDAKIPGLLKEMNICKEGQTNLNNASDPACDSKFFHFETYADGVALENAFIVVIRAGVHDWSVRRTLVYTRENGKLVLVNTFIGNLVGKKIAPSGKNDLVMQFFDEYENRLECIYKWKEGRYQYASVSRIEGSKIRKQLQDSMNVEIYKVLKDNKLDY
jgi:hypothetical protein